MQADSLYSMYIVLSRPMRCAGTSCRCVMTMDDVHEHGGLTPIPWQFPVRPVAHRHCAKATIGEEGWRDGTRRW